MSLKRIIEKRTENKNDTQKQWNRYIYKKKEYMLLFLNGYSTYHSHTEMKQKMKTKKKILYTVLYLLIILNET